MFLFIYKLSYFLIKNQLKFPKMLTKSIKIPENANKID